MKNFNNAVLMRVFGNRRFEIMEVHALRVYLHERAEEFWDAVESDEPTQMIDLLEDIKSKSRIFLKGDAQETAVRRARMIYPDGISRMFPIGIELCLPERPKKTPAKTKSSKKRHPVSPNALIEDIAACHERFKSAKRIVTTRTEVLEDYLDYNLGESIKYMLDYNLNRIRNTAETEVFSSRVERVMDWNFQLEGIDVGSSKTLTFKNGNNDFIPLIDIKRIDESDGEFELTWLPDDISAALVLAKIMGAGDHEVFMYASDDKSSVCIEIDMGE